MAILFILYSFYFLTTIFKTLFMKSLKSSTIFFALLSIFFSCKKNTDSSPTHTPEAIAKGSLLFHLHTNIDSTEVLYGDTALDASGRKIVLSIAQFYISGITAQNTDGSVVTFPGVYLLKKTETEPYAVGSIPAGNYTSVSFVIGLDSIANTNSPSMFSDSSNVLSAQTPSMWFGNVSQGYIFMNVQGFADTTLDKTGLPNIPFSFKIGSNKLCRKITMPQQNFTVTANQQQEIHMVCDYGKLIQGINFKTQNTTDTYTINPSVANQIANNIPSMFSYAQ
jgi:hypothetical protein